MNINISKDEQSNEFLYCVGKIGKDFIPSIYTLYDTFHAESFIKSLDIKDKDIFTRTESIPAQDIDLLNVRHLSKVIDDVYVAFTEYDKDQENCSIVDVIFYYKITKQDEVSEYVSLIKESIIEVEEESEEQKVNTLTLTTEGLFLEPIIINKVENMDVFHSKKTRKQIKSLTKKINSNKKGLNIIYGERGTGKTTIVKHLIGSIDKVIIFVPSNMIDTSLNSNEFRMLIKRYSECLVIIDDCEIYFSETHARSNAYTNNIIQMVDGLVSDTYNIQFLLIMNVSNIDSIDGDLFECNNLQGEIEVKKCSSERIQKICDFLSIKNRFEGDHRLSDVINNKYEDIEKSIGF